MIPQTATPKTTTKANTPIKALAEPRVGADGRAVYFDTDFPFGANAPHDAQDSHDSHDLKDSHDIQDTHDLNGQSLTISVGETPRSDFLLNLPFGEYLREVLR